jgi:hypothetical protein
MSNHTSRSAAAHQPPINPVDVDALLLDAEFDDSVDSQIAAIRESLADYRDL